MPEITPEQAVQFKSALRDQTAIWNDTPPDYTTDPGTELAYDQMGKILLSRVRDSGIDTVFQSPAVNAGMSIVPRFMYAGARLASLQGMSPEQLHRAMYNHDSYNTLAEITREPDPTAKRIEVSLGLKPTTMVSVDYHLDEFSLSEESGLTIPYYSHHRVSARLDAISQGHVDQSDIATRFEPKCPAERTGILQMTYRSMLLISMSDPHLFQATLIQAGQPVEASHPA